MKLNTQLLEQVITLLIEKYPNRLPHDNISLENLNRLVGQQDVIIHLTQLLESQERRSPNGKQN